MAQINEAEEITGNDFEKKTAKGVFAVDFWASWCMPCLMMAPIVDEIAEKFPKIKFMKVNVDENQKLAEKFKVLSIPTLIIFKNGKEAGRIIGSQSIEQLEEKLKNLI